MYAGTVGEILVEVGETVPVNTVLGTILAEGEQPAVPDANAPVQTIDVLPQDATSPAAEATEDAGPGTSPPVGPATDVPPQAATSPASQPVQVVPLARKLAREHGLDLATVVGTGPRGRITVADVEQAIAEPSGSPAQASPAAPPTGKRMSQMRKVIAKRMVESLQTSAQLTLVSTADVTDLVAMRAAWRDGPKPSFTDAVIRACALALRKHPQINARIDGDQVVEFESIAIGMAVAVDAGLVVPVVRDADQYDLRALASVTADLAARAKTRQLGLDDYSGGTFSVTSLGGQGVDMFTPILNAPEPAIMGVGRAKEVAVRTPDGLAWRWQLTLSVTIDHRLIDGYPGALFLADVVELLADTSKL